MTDRRKKDIEWDVAEKDGSVPTWERAQLAVLMDIRDELQRLNRLLHCQNFVAIPRKLDAIARKLPTRRKRKAKP